TSTASPVKTPTIPPQGAWPMQGHDPGHSGLSPYVSSQFSSLRWISSNPSLSYNFGSSPPAVGLDGTVVDVAGNGDVYAFTPDGAVKWMFQAATLPFGGVPIGGPIIAGGGTVYAYLGPPGVALRAGGLVWSYTTFYPVQAITLGSDGTILVPSGDGNLYDLTLSGILVWKFALGSASTGVVVGPDGTIYAGSTINGLYALNPSGSLKWTYS